MLARRAALAASLLLAVPAAADDDDGEGARRALAARAEALAREPESAARFGEEARLLHYLAVATPDGAERDALHARGVRAAERALALDPDHPAGLLWWTAHRGAQATPLRPLEAIRIAADVERKLLRLRDLDPEYEHAAADRVLGHVYRVAPSVISVGSLKKAEQHLRDALARAPAYPGNLLAFAQLRAQQGRCDAARRGAELVLASPLVARYPLDADAWTRGARQLLDGDCR